MATYLAVPLKRTWEVDVIKPLKKFITETYGTENEVDYNNALQEFSKLRGSIITKAVDKHESALEVLYRYYDQLVAIESKFPISENQIRINFKWQDAFDKASLLSGKKTLSLSSSSYEKVCLLFNIAAMQSQVACVQDHTSDAGLKLTAKLFQQSAAIFNRLKDCVLSHIQNDPTPDMQPDVLGVLSSLMLAQGQECICRKVMSEEKKPAMIAKLSQQCTEMYAVVIKQMQMSSLISLWPKNWVPSVAQSQAAFHALAEYFQSLVSKENKEFGEEIARLKHAKELMVSAETRGGYTFSFQKYSKRINVALTAAEKDNNLIYHAHIPEVASLPPIDKMVIAKYIEMDAASMSTRFTDLFEKVVPLAVHQAVSGFDSRKSDVVNSEIGRIREANQLLDGALQSLNLPAAIEDLRGEHVPQSILEKSAKIKEMGGITYLTGLMTDLPDLLTRNKQILDESLRELNEEQASDTQLRAQFGERWTRTASEKLTAPLHAESSKYRQIIDTAMGADHTIKDTFQQHREYIQMLSGENGSLQSGLPSADPASNLKDSPVVQELKQLCEQASTLKAEREVMEAELKDATFDITGKFMSALSQDGVIDDTNIASTELDRVYQPLREQITSSVHRQESVLANIQRCNDQFISAKSQSKSQATREEKLRALVAAYNSFTQLKANLEEGTKFYNELTILLVKFQSKVQDLCFARKTEKEELMKDLNNSIANQRTTPIPQQPNYQQPTAQQKPVAPPRPPPPTINNNKDVPSSATAPSASAPPSLPPHAAAPPQPAAPQPYAAAPTYPGYAPAAAAGAPMPPVQQLPYPAQPQYQPPPMPMGYNPYAPAPAYPPQQYPGYPPQQVPPGQPQQYQAAYPGYAQPPQQPQWR